MINSIEPNTKCTEILEQAKKFNMSCMDNHIKPTWQDYEYFKNQLHNENIYGAEPILATILGL